MGIPFLADIERLITEHGSAAILRERLSLAAEQYAALERKVAELESENTKLNSENSELQQQVRNLKNSGAPNGNPSGYVCDHCGSSNIKRTGSRPDPTFGRLGVKQAVFLCESCGKESSFQQKP
jgi:predicted RNA-binding Zn-ribbon protein involved in translation (DUF1610 family)